MLIILLINERQTANPPMKTKKLGITILMLMHIVHCARQPESTIIIGIIINY